MAGLFIRFKLLLTNLLLVLLRTRSITLFDGGCFLLWGLVGLDQLSDLFLLLLLVPFAFGLGTILSQLRLFILTLFIFGIEQSSFLRFLSERG